jgi:hypothetical protein
MKTSFFVLAGVLTSWLMCAASISAADLTLTLSKDQKTVDIVNNLRTKVVILFLLPPKDRTIPFFSKLEAGEKRTLPLRHAIPVETKVAGCQVEDPLKGMQKIDMNYYELSVEVKK